MFLQPWHHDLREEQPMTPLRKRMIEDMRMRDYSEHTISAYVSAVYRLAAFYRRSPDQLGREEIRAFLVDLVEEQRVAWSYYKQVLAALRYFYRYVLRRGEVVEDVRGPRVQKKLPIVLSAQEVAQFFQAIPSLKHRTILMLAYGAGLRVGEAVRVRLADIDRQRKVLRVSQGKGRKDRYTLLSPALLEMLDRYCWAARPQDLLFTTRSTGRAITASTVQRVCKQAQQDAQIDKTITPHTLRHAYS
jgi:site-specific recombinase XerD